MEFKITIITGEHGEPDGVLIQDSEGVTGTWRKPIKLENFEVMRLFDELSFVAEKLIFYDAISHATEYRSRDTPAFKKQMDDLRLHEYITRTPGTDAISLRFKLHRLQDGYRARLLDLKDKPGNCKAESMIRDWSMKAHETYMLVLLGRKDEDVARTGEKKDADV